MSTRSSLIVAVVALCAVQLINADTPPPFVCRGRPDGFFVRDVTQCNAFFHCDAQGVPARGHCDDPFLFDEPSQRCDWECFVDCFTCPNDPFAELEVSGSCSQFIRCVQGRPEHLECASGLFFDPLISTCNHQHLVDCNDDVPNFECPPVDDPNNRVFFRDPVNCAVFFVCIAGRPHRQQCAPTLHFNTDTNQCDHPSNTDCPDHPVITPPPPSGFDCRAQAPLPVPIFPHPTNCSQFYICDTEHNAHLQTCGVGLLFSPQIQGCDVPDRVTCAPGATKGLTKVYDLNFTNTTSIIKRN